MFRMLANVSLKFLPNCLQQANPFSMASNSSQPIYLDYNATTPTDPEVAKEMYLYLTTHFGNPTSAHFYGQQPKQALATARKQVADLINAKPESVIFTSGSSESNNFAIFGALKTIKKIRPQANQIITSTIEHKSITYTVDALAEEYEVIKLNTDANGVVSVEELEKNIDPERTALVSIMYSNNEVGTIQPVKKIAEICKKNNVIFHSDASQAIGKIPVDVTEVGVDLLSIAGHKFYGPKGIGCLYVSPSFQISTVIHGVGQEFGLRGGTENVSGIVGIGKAAELAKIEFDNKYELVIKQKRDRLRDLLLEKFPNAVINGHPTDVVPNTLSISFQVPAFRLMEALKNRVCFSAGAACNSGKVVSPTLGAMGVSSEVAIGTIRLSVGRFTTNEQIEEAAKILIETIQAESEQLNQ